MYVMSAQVNGEHFYISSKGWHTIMLTRRLEKAKTWQRNEVILQNDLSNENSTQRLYDVDNRRYIWDRSWDASTPPRPLIRFETKKVTLILE